MEHGTKWSTAALSSFLLAQPPLFLWLSHPSPSCNPIFITARDWAKKFCCFCWKWSRNQDRDKDWYSFSPPSAKALMTTAEKSVSLSLSFKNSQRMDRWVSSFFQLNLLPPLLWLLGPSGNGGTRKWNNVEQSEGLAGFPFPTLTFLLASTDSH